MVDGLIMCPSIEILLGLKDSLVMHFTGTDEAGRAADTIAVHKSYEKVLQVPIQCCIQGD